MAERAPDVPVPALIEGIIRRCMEKNPNHRYDDAQPLYLALKEARLRLFPEMVPSSETTSGADTYSPGRVISTPLNKASDDENSDTQSTTNTAPTLKNQSPPSPAEHQPHQQQTQPPPAANRSWPLLLGGAAALLLVPVAFVLGNLLPAFTPTATDEFRPPPPEPTEIVEAEPAPEPEPALHEVSVVIGSSPSGAEIFRDEELLGVTPFSGTLQLGPEDERLQIWVIKKAGHQQVELAIDLSQEHLAENVLLPEVQRRPFSQRRRSATSPPTPQQNVEVDGCLLYTSPSPRARTRSRMPSSA